MWKASYGFADVKKVAHDLHDVSKVAKYVSTYSYKGNPANMSALDDGYCLKPRRCTSAHFGIGEDFASLSRYLKCEDIYGSYDPDDEEFVKSHPEIVEDVLARRVYTINGFKYPVPKYIMKKIFWKDETRRNPKTGEEEVAQVATALQRMVTNAIFRHSLDDADRKSREYERTLTSSTKSVCEKFAADVSVQQAEEAFREQDYRQTLLTKDAF